MQPLASPLLAMPLAQLAPPIHFHGPACPTQATLPATAIREYGMCFWNVSIQSWGAFYESQAKVFMALHTAANVQTQSVHG